MASADFNSRKLSRQRHCLRKHGNTSPGRLQWMYLFSCMKTVAQQGGARVTVLLEDRLGYNVHDILLWQEA